MAPLRVSGLERIEMNRTEPSFEEVARQHFGFLIRENGFHCTAASEFKIRFESKLVFIEIYHGQYDYEVGINFGRRGRDENFSFTLFLRRFFPVVDQALGERLAETPKRIGDLTQAMGETLRTYGQRIIDGDDAFYTEMAQVRWWHFKPEAVRNPKSSS